MSGWDVSGWDVSGWDVSDYLDAVVFVAAAPLRSNLVFLVRGECVVAFAPSRMSMEFAYERLS